MKKNLIYITLLISTHLLAQFPGAGNTIDFQNNRAILAPTGNDLNPTDEYTDLTIEAWVYWRGNTGGRSGIMEGRPGAVHFETTDNNDPGRIRVRVHDNNALQVNNVLEQGEWVHLAFVYSNESGSEGITLYKNGEEVGFRAGAMGGATRNFSSVLRFGISCCNTGNGRPFNGLLDEIRVWYKAKAPAEIREQMCKKLTLPQTDLTLYYRLDEIVGTTVFDLSGNGNHGTTENIDPATHHVLSGAPIGDESEYWHGVPFAGNTYYHESSFGDSLSVSNITGDPDGLHIYSVEELPNSTAGTTGLGANEHYYGVFIANDYNSTYDATYYYGNNPAYLASAPTIDENDITLFIREDNAQTIWANSGAPVNLANQTLTTNNVFRQEYILGLDNLEALPVELISFQASLTQNEAVILDWSTATEINNDFFTLERSRDGVQFEEIGEVEGAGNSNQKIDYQFIDKSPYPGVSYYRLKQIDYDGKYSYSDIRSVNLVSGQGVQLFPNPVSSGGEIELSITNSEDLNGTYTIFNTAGKTIQTGQTTNNKIKIDLASGLYFIELRNENLQVKKKFVVE